MTFRASYPSMAGGEVSEAIAARWDVAKYTTALSLARNTLGLPQGGQYNRPGFLLCDKVPDSSKAAVVFPFIFATGNAYALEFSPLLMRIYYRGELVTRPKLTITGISNATQAVVTVPDHDYVVGWTLAFDGVAGMIEINGLRAKVIEVIDGNQVRIDLNTTAFGAFSGDTGGVAGDVQGGTGGYAPPLPPGEDPPPVDQPDDPPPPPIGGGTKCPGPDVLVLLANEARDGPGEQVRAADVREGQDFVWAPHEVTGEWGAYFVLLAKRVENQRRHTVVLEDGRSDIYAHRHRFFVEKTRWTMVESIAVGTVIEGYQPGVLASIDPAEDGPVIEFVIHRARTLVTGGLSSHNVKPIE